MTSGKGKGKYFVEFWVATRGSTYSHSVKTKSQALRYAKSYMRN